MTGIVDGPWYYQQIDLGFNYRMTDMHKTPLGYSQMQKLMNLSKRRYLVKRYNELLKTSMVFSCQIKNEDTKSSLAFIRCPGDFLK